MSTVAELELGGFADPIAEALRAYGGIANGDVVFDIDHAIDLALTPDKPNSARSKSQVEHLGEVVGDLFVIVFDYEDGTGDESLIQIGDEISFGFLPGEAKCLPRSKAAVHSEVHLTIASQSSSMSFANGPVMYAGSLDLLMPRDAKLQEDLTIETAATLGHDLTDTDRAIIGEYSPKPRVTYTTGYRDGSGERFGDPHAVFNPRLYVQVCGFLAISHETADTPKHGDLMKKLGAVEPSFTLS